MKSKRSVGFTLVEVLVAIAVIAFTVPSVMLLMSKQTNYAGILRDKTIAQWVAQNKMVELHHNRIHKGQLPQRERTDVIEMVGREWQAILDIEKTDIGAKYTIRVGLDKDTPIVTLETFLVLDP